MRGIIFVLTLLAAGAATAAPLTEWSKAKDGEPKTYHLGGYTLTFTTAGTDDADMSATVLTAAAPGAKSGVLRGEPGMNGSAAYFGIARIDPRNPDPVILMSTYTGGAHCCDAVKLLERAGAGWRVVDIGMWDGDVLSDMPKDVDGDGVIDFVLNDNAFLYAFSSYAGSFPPPKILNVVDGKVIDVSKAPRYRKLFLAHMEAAKKDCAGHDNGACAGYVASAARAGLHKRAWAFMLAHYDLHSSQWPTRCKGKWVDGDCKGAERKPKDFPQALSWFLADTGYTP
ncbi:MAG TPA: hypothetical protein VGF56_04250 [Rhizomicrobium sp.]|jgi:hypothetical protein